MTKKHRPVRQRLAPAILLAAALLALQPQSAMSDGIAGNLVNDIFGALLGAGAGEGLGCLVQGCSSSDNWSTVNKQLSSLSAQISTLNSAIQADTCYINGGVYTTFMSGDNTHTLNAIALLAADLSAIAADRAAIAADLQAGNTSQLTKDKSQLKDDLNQLTTDQTNTSNLSTIHADMNGIVRGVAGSPGGIQLYSTQLTTCHTYFNSNDFLLVQNQWTLFALAQANACVIKINLDKKGDPANDLKACKAYQSDINAAQVPQMATPTSLQLMTPKTFIDVKTGIGWQLGDLVTASYQKLWDNGGGHAFAVYSVPGLGRSGQPWQQLPYYKDIQTLLNDSQCPNSNQPNQPACLANQGWPDDSNSFWADSAYSNVVDPSPKGPWGGKNFCESANCKCANGDCYDWYNIIYQDTSGATVDRLPPCWTSALGDPYPSGLLAWECGVVDAAAAGFNPVGTQNGAHNLSEWVGVGALNHASGTKFSSGYYWTGTPPFPPSYVAAARQPTAKPTETARTTASPKPAEAVMPARARGR